MNGYLASILLALVALAIGLLFIWLTPAHKDASRPSQHQRKS